MFAGPDGKRAVSHTYYFFVAAGKPVRYFYLYTAHLYSILACIRRATVVVMSPYSIGVEPCLTMLWCATAHSVGVN